MHIYYRLKKKLIIPVIFTFFIFMLFIMTGCNKANEQEPNNNNTNDNIETSDMPANDIKPLVETELCPLCGEYINKRLIIDKRPIAVMIDNLSNARPQSGLTKADIVYELPFEGGITRFLAIYLHNENISEIGPIRSARHYCLDLVLEYDAVYIYFGGSPQAWDQIEKLKIEGMNGIYDGVTFYRHKGKKAPHDKYTNVEKINKTIKSRKINMEVCKKKFIFDENKVLEGEQTKLLNIKYPIKYLVTYEYDEDLGNYLRKINDKPHKDALNEEQISTKNIIIQFVRHQVIDSEGRLDIKMVGDGKGLYISNGIIKEIKWKKDSRDGETHFMTTNNEKLTINPGKTWIHLITKDTNISFE
ncbi:MAG TPA: DUF3048 domain-containing protein [Thermoanaerobacterales bacterium]|nr:DUF3048 domain-containing protein [Thermoanaerobacterales bacterium]